MKKLLAMLMAMLLSMFENVDYQYQSERPFNHDSYYTIDVPAQTVDYRDLYGKQIAAGGSYSCIPTTYNVSCYTVNYSDGVTRVGAKWVVANEHKDIAEISGTTYTFESNSPIACPYAGTLLTSSNTSTGTIMEIAISVNGKNYRMYIEDMERWWCCDSKKDYDFPDTKTWEHTCSELKGTTFKAGTCLGRARANSTSIHVIENGNKVDLAEFFSN